jgi:hypothetical protein
MIRIEAVTEISIRFYPFHIRYSTPHEPRSPQQKKSWCRVVVAIERENPLATDGLASLLILTARCRWRSGAKPGSLPDRRTPCVNSCFQQAVLGTGATAAPGTSER